VRAAVVIATADPDRPPPLPAGLKYMTDGKGRCMIGPNGQFIVIEESAVPRSAGFPPQP
jgi:hypothetical protein